MPFNYKDNFRAEFLKKSQEEKEFIFSLSCFDAKHWEQAVHWGLREKEVNESIRSICVDLFDSKWNAFERKNDWTQFKTRYWYQGPMVNYLLAWYIEDEFNYYCQPEGPKDNGAYDILVQKGDRNVCSIGIKRLVKAKRMKDYLQDHREKIQSHRVLCENHYVLNLFPVSDTEEPGRVENLVRGYGYISEDLHDFFEEDHVFVDNVAAPINKDNLTDFGPLKTVKNHLNDRLGL